MKAASGIGIGVAILAILGGAMIEGTSLGILMNIPALSIVLGGTAGVTLAAVGMETFLAMPKLLIRATSSAGPDLAGRAQELVGFAEQARRDGLLSLESSVGQVDDAFCRRGLQLVVDGTEAGAVRDVMEGEIDAMAARHAVGSGAFEKAGGFAPTIGILGAVLGLMHALGFLDQPAMLGPAIAGAFVATLLGVGLANIVMLPIGNRLQALSLEEQGLREMTMEGVLAIQAGENPRIVSERLQTFVPPAQRSALADDGGSDGAASIDEARRRKAA
ncbi:motility protein A [Patulibacter sp. NPDC049589]|uniref:motility protein A n=1 Tax=Patulibacter sp. NPDC049589 TaxID=3154731 RepID=UPI0034275B76